jgi:hypothetical protein
MSVSKQMLIDNISALSYDVKQIIKEFAFYEEKAGKEILRQKCRHVMVNNAISKDAVSRNNPSIHYFDEEANSSTSEDWTFYYYEEDVMTEYSIMNAVYEPTYLSSVNCCRCGNYKVDGRQDYINRIICLCNRR